MQRNRQDPDLLDLTIPVPGNTLMRLVPDYFTKTLGAPLYVPFDDSYFRKAPMVWCSWASYYEECTEQDIVRNADWIAAHLKPYGFEYVELDEGYDGGKNGRNVRGRTILDREVGPDEISPRAEVAGRTISSPKACMRAYGLSPTPMREPWSSIRTGICGTSKGRSFRDYNTPALDSTNPEVLDFLKKLFTTLDDWGFDYYKFDGEFALPSTRRLLTWINSTTSPSTLSLLIGTG